MLRLPGIQGSIGVRIHEEPSPVLETAVEAEDAIPGLKTRTAADAISSSGEAAIHRVAIAAIPKMAGISDSVPRIMEMQFRRWRQDPALRRP